MGIGGDEFLDQAHLRGGEGVFRKPRERLPGEAPLFKAGPLLLILETASFLLSVLLKWPFCAWAIIPISSAVPCPDVALWMEMTGTSLAERSTGAATKARTPTASYAAR